ncbi:MAG: 2-oxoacid:acceptor oxidoreductase subunit alpha [Alphaproteobacteria bacterium]|nr:2-oxoacid:acceptor oxidoreductase subunit alpha [Alphaproteobacteria bacterium]
MNQADTKNLEQVVIRFAGDSGDGMQVVGSQFTRTSALVGNDLATLPDFPAEIRAPAGTREGVSGFQIQLADHQIFTPGDQADALVALNAAALVTNLGAVRPGGIVIVNTDKFAKLDLDKARLSSNPLEDGTLDGYRVIRAPISTMTKDAVEPLGLKTKEADRCKNFYCLGVVYWLYGRPLDATEAWVRRKFKSPYLEANLAALHAGHAWAETSELFQNHYAIPSASLPSGDYRNITGNMGIALGLAAAAVKSGATVFYGSYPITPASDILHNLAPFKHFGVATFQAEDEIAAVCAAIGASYGGAIGVTGTSGPGLALKAEAVGLALTAELPLVIVDVQRAGPSTGLPTKTEQSDLMQAMYGRNGESPVAVIAASRPNDTFEVALEAVRLSVKYRTPVILLSDGYIANGAEPWTLPDIHAIPRIPIDYAKAEEAETFQPYARDPETLARPWAVPGTPGLEHRIGGLEKQDRTGNVSYDPANHQKMCELRAEKILRMRADIPPTQVHGSADGTLLIGWGSTFGAIRTVTDQLLADGHRIAHVHLRHLNPLPGDLGDVLSRYERVLVPELNLGQLVRLLRDLYLVDARPISKIQGQPFFTSELRARVVAAMA